MQGPLICTRKLQTDSLEMTELQTKRLRASKRWRSGTSAIKHAYANKHTKQPPARHYHCRYHLLTYVAYQPGAHTTRPRWQHPWIDLANLAEHEEEADCLALLTRFAVLSRKGTVDEKSQHTVSCFAPSACQPCMALSIASFGCEQHRRQGQFAVAAYLCLSGFVLS